MSRLDADRLRQSIRPDVRLEHLETFDEIASTNTYLMQSDAPSAGCCRVAVTDNQTAGRGRHDRRWESPPGSGLCLSVAYTFAALPDNVSAVTLAVGIGAMAALERLGVGGVSLKWPNDIVLNDAKLGGILSETRQAGNAAVTVVTGIGINVCLPDGFDVGVESEWATRAVDLRAAGAEPPSHESIAVALVEELATVFAEFDTNGFGPFPPRWTKYDWLHGKAVRVDARGEEMRGEVRGIDDDGALLLATATGTKRIISGSIELAGVRGEVE